MKPEEIETMLEKVEIPFRYHHFTQTEMEEIPLPILVWNLPGTDNFVADGQVYQTIRKLDIELYTEEKSWQLEERLERVLNDHGLGWEQTASAWLESEGMWETLYEMEVME